MNQFFVTAIAEKVSALKTDAYFRERQTRGDLSAFDDWLAASPEAAPIEGDELALMAMARASGALAAGSGMISGMLQHLLTRRGKVLLHRRYRLPVPAECGKQSGSPLPLGEAG